VKSEQFWREMAEGKRRGAGVRLLVGLLALGAVPYGMLLRVRAWAYATGILPSRRLDRPVISVGNITVGGTGKTPMTALIARYLMSRGKRVAVLSRGYGGTSGGESRIVSDGAAILLSAVEAGDEPYLLATELPGLMVVIGHDRYEAGRFAERELSPDCFLLDDGYQHLKLRRDLNILLLDCRNPFGNGWTLPAGVLREPRSAISRADIIVLTRCDSEGQLLHEAPGGVPVLSARHRLSGIVPLSGGEIQPFSALLEENVLAFAGIADPDRFFSGLAEVGIDVVGTISFPDHAVYDDRTIAGIQQLFRSTGATCLVTTAKDAVKLGQRRKQLGRVWVAQMELILADPTALETTVDSLFQRTGKSA
jgi:tetraacyldisaccharide 4'-kinase